MESVVLAISIFLAVWIGYKMGQGATLDIPDIRSEISPPRIFKFPPKGKTGKILTRKEQIKKEDLEYAELIKN